MPWRRSGPPSCGFQLAALRLLAKQRHGDHRHQHQPAGEQVAATGASRWWSCDEAVVAGIVPCGLSVCCLVARAACGRSRERHAYRFVLVSVLRGQRPITTDGALIAAACSACPGPTTLPPTSFPEKDLT